MTARRITPDVRLVSRGGGFWVSEDGRWEVKYDDDFTTECDRAHPVRLTTELRTLVSERPWLWPVEAVEAVRARKAGYLCPGEQEHPYGRWHIWDHARRDYLVGSGPGAYESFTAAVHDLARYVTTTPA